MSFRVRGDVGWESVSFVDATYREIDEAARLVEAAAAGIGVDPELKAQVKELDEALPTALPGTTKKNRVQVVKEERTGGSR